MHGAHDGDRILALEGKGHNRATGDECLDGRVIGRVDMFRIVLGGQVGIHMTQLHRADPQALALIPGDDLSHQATPDGIGLQQDQRSFRPGLRGLDFRRGDPPGRVVARFTHSHTLNNVSVDLGGAPVSGRVRLSAD
ncbi:hypothetical protein BMR99_03705 [Propionibacterium freudenreichii]|nr:hypothetical protein BMR99_03705 [Propionibacterium freudenreichii]